MIRLVWKSFKYLPRQKLFNKLRKEGIQGRFLKLLISMYSSRTSMKNWAPTNLANILSDQKILNQVLRKGKIFLKKL